MIGASKFLRGAGYRSYLGLNPETIAKQGLTYIDMHIIESLPVKIPPHIQRIINRIARPVVTERMPSIEVADTQLKIDRGLLFGIAWADKAVANGLFDKLLAKELMSMEKEGIKLSTKSLRQAVARISDKIDLGAGGVTAAQRPPFYRSEVGKLALMLTSTINSRMQYYLKNAIQGINDRDVFMLAKIATAGFLAAYAEVVIVKQAHIWGEDTKAMAKDILRSAGGNIPVAGGMMYALDIGRWSPSAVFANVAEAIEKTGKMLDDKESLSRVLFGWAEVAGLPKQIRKTTGGIRVIQERGVREKEPRKGKAVKRMLVPVSEPMEQVRHLISGKWGGLEATEYVKKIGKPKKKPQRRFVIPAR